MFGNKYRILLDHDILRDKGVFCPHALFSELLFQITLADAGNVAKGSDQTKLSHELTNIEIEYLVIQDEGLEDEAESSYPYGRSFKYDQINHHKHITVNKGTIDVINEIINAPGRSIKGILILFIDLYNKGARDAEKFFNPDITK